MAIQSRYFSSTAVKTTLVSAITNTATSFSVGSTTGWPVSLPFTLIIDRDLATEEVIEVTTISGTNITACTRGKDGTTAVAHSAGATVEHGVSARDFNDPQAHMSAFAAVHGLQTGSQVVGTTDTQTLTNKTMTSPTLNTPTINSTAVPSTLALGFVAGASSNAVTSGWTTTLTIYSGISNLAFTTVAGRRYKVTVRAVIDSSVAGDSVNCIILDGAGSAPTTGSTQSDINRVPIVTASRDNNVSYSFYWTPSAGQHNLAIAVIVSVGTGTGTVGSPTYPTSLFVEDIGV